MAEQWPLDVSKLKKGDYISPEQCEEIIGTKRDNKKYSLRLLALCESIHKECGKADIKLALRCVKDGIEVMTDDTASEYYTRQFHSGLRQCGRANRRQINLVDRSALSEENQRGHDRAIALQSMVLSSNRKIIRKFKQKQLPKSK